MPRRWELALLRELYNTLEERRFTLEMDFIYTGSREKGTAREIYAWQFFCLKIPFTDLNVKHE